MITFYSSKQAFNKYKDNDVTKLEIKRGKPQNIHKCSESEKYPLECTVVGHWRNQEGNFKIPIIKWKWGQFSRSFIEDTSNWKVYNYECLHWKIRFQTNNLDVLAKQEGVKPQSSKPQEIMKIMAEINKKWQQRQYVDCM